MNKWAPAEDAKLTALVREGGRTWAQIAAELPGRSSQACSNRALLLREQGQALNDPEREQPQGLGAGAGRPRNKDPKVNANFRLAVDVKKAFGELCTATGEKPGSLLRHALAVCLGRDELYDVLITSRPMDVHALRVAACWSVPATLLDQVAAKLEAPRYVAAEHAVLELLKAYGYTIESKL